MANWLTYRIRVGDNVLVLADEEARELIKNETERSKKADAQTASFLESTTSNGIIRNGKSDPFGQTAIGGMKVVIDKGDLIINGNIKNHKRLTRTYNVMQENRTEVFLYRFDSVTNEITGLWRDCIIQGDIILSREDKTELPLRSNGYYDILICKITIPAGATEITQDMIGDFRQNEYYCGYAKNLLVDIDETLTKSDAAADAAAVGTAIGNLRKETRTRDIITEKRITNLEQGLPAERWSVDDSVAYIKDVPENALPFASVDVIGGMTRKCANLIPPKNDIGTISGLSFTNNADGSITVNGTATHNIYLNLADFYNLDGEYYISGCPAGGSIDTYRIIVDENNKGNAYDIGEGARFTAKKGNVYSILISVLEGVTLTNAVFKPMLNRGTTALPYEPYFEGLRSASVEKIESVGANLFDINAAPADNGTANYMVDKRTGRLSGTFARAHTPIRWKIKVPKNDLITFGFTSATDTACTFQVSSYYQSYQSSFDEQVDARLDMSKGAHHATVDSGDFDELTVTIYSSHANESFDISGVMINYGAIALPYTPYRRNTLPIPDEVQALDGYGWGISDTLYNYIDFEKKQFVKRVERIDMGTMLWTMYTDNYFGISFFLSNTDLPKRKFGSGVGTFLCAPYEAVRYRPHLEDKCISPYNDTNNNQLCVMDNSYTDAEAFKSAMSGVWLYYELAEPVITDISDILPDDNLIRVEGGGTVTMVNEYGYDVPSEITYQLKGAEA